VDYLAHMLTVFSPKPEIVTAKLVCTLIKQLIFKNY